GRIGLAGLSVLADRDRALAGGDIDGDDLGLEGARGDGVLGAGQAFDGVFVHLFAGELILGGRVFGEDAHRLAGGIGVFQAVHHHAVDDDVVADAGAAAVLVHQIGGARHRLHAARDNDLGGAGQQGVVRHHGGLEPRTAHLVHRRRLDVLAEAGADGGLTGRGLAQTGGQDAAHEDLLDLFRRD